MADRANRRNKVGPSDKAIKLNAKDTQVTENFTQPSLFNTQSPIRSPLLKPRSLVQADKSTEIALLTEIVNEQKNQTHIMRTLISSVDGLSSILIGEQSARKEGNPTNSALEDLAETLKGITQFITDERSSKDEFSRKQTAEKIKEEISDVWNEKLNNRTELYLKKYRNQEKSVIMEAKLKEETPLVLRKFWKPATKLESDDTDLQTVRVRRISQTAQNNIDFLKIISSKQNKSVNTIDEEMRETILSLTNADTKLFEESFRTWQQEYKTKETKAEKSWTDNRIFLENKDNYIEVKSLKSEKIFKDLEEAETQDNKQSSSKPNETKQDTKIKKIPDTKKSPTENKNKNQTTQRGEEVFRPGHRSAPLYLKGQRQKFEKNKY